MNIPIAIDVAGLELVSPIAINHVGRLNHGLEAFSRATRDACTVSWGLEPDSG